MDDFILRFLYFGDKAVKNTYLDILNSIEELKDKGEISEEVFTLLRKKILDSGNREIRNLHDNISNIDKLIKLLLKE